MDYYDGFNLIESVVKSRCPLLIAYFRFDSASYFTSLLRRSNVTVPGYLKTQTLLYAF